jgi:primosomal protein N' (replication factor Y)
VPFVRVAFPVPLRQTFVYSVPDALFEAAAPGAEVRCPFGARERRGFVVERAQTADRAAVKPILSVVSDGPVFSPDLLRLCLWIAEYYLAPIGRVLAGALPGGLEGFGGSRARKGARAAPGPVALTALPGERRLTAAQKSAATAISDAMGAGAYAGFLLHGVTGSGKTEVYLEIAEACRRAGRRTLVLVPEIALAHQIVTAFRARFGDRVGVLHSYLSVGDRRASWQRARQGGVDVIVGARSAVFAPLPRLGLLIVDEEHDPAYKQSEQIRYHGRDTALVRARLSNAIAVLGSATPSLESWANAERGKLRRLMLPERIDGRPLPVVEIVDLNEVKPARIGDKPAKSRAPALFTPALLDGLAATLARSDQALVFLNRRGHTRVVECEDCGFVLKCASCDVSLTWHSSDGTFRCHYCDRIEPALGACPKCGSPFFRHKGSGTQKAEKELKAHFPEARILRLDSDSARPRGAQASILAAFGRREADILLGTQMIAKGLDFHGVTFVGVVSADGSLHLPDFRAAERTFQMLVQVAGRAGRGRQPGKVVVQTRVPDHPSLVAAQAHDFEAFAVREAAFRKDLGYPPYGRLVALLLSGTDESKVIAAAEQVARAVREARVVWEAQAEERGAVPLGALDLLGPAPSPLARLRGKHRWRLTLKDRDTKRLHAVTRLALETLESAEGRLPAGVLLAVDVDPYDVL